MCIRFRWLPLSQILCTRSKLNHSWYVSRHGPVSAKWITPVSIKGHSCSTILLSKSCHQRRTLHHHHCTHSSFSVYLCIHLLQLSLPLHLMIMIYLFTSSFHFFFLIPFCFAETPDNRLSRLCPSSSSSPCPYERVLKFWSFCGRNSRHRGHQIRRHDLDLENCQTNQGRHHNQTNKHAFRKKSDTGKRHRSRHYVGTC